MGIAYAGFGRGYGTGAAGSVASLYTVQANDVQLAWHVTHSSAGAVTIPGWQTLQQNDVGLVVGGFLVRRLMWRRGPGSFDFTTANAASWSVGIIAYRGVVADRHPFAISEQNVGGGTSLTAPSRSSSPLHGLAVFGFAAADYGIPIASARLDPRGLLAHYGADRPYSVFVGDREVAPGPVGTYYVYVDPQLTYLGSTVVLIPQNLTPNAPQLTVPAKVNLALPFDVAAALSDPNAGDTASASFLRFRQANTTTWTKQLSRVDAITTVRVPADFLTAGEWEVQGASRDAGGLPVGDANLLWSGSKRLTAAVAPAGATIVTPVTGATIGSSTQTYVISSPELEALQWRIVGDSGGLPNEADVIHAGATIETGDLRRFTAVGLPNGRTVHAQFRARLGGLYQTEWSSTSNPVSFTPPPKPVLAVEPIKTQPLLGDFTDATALTLLNPTPTGSQPALAFNELRVRLAAVGGDGARVLVPGTDEPLRLSAGVWTDGWSPSDVELQWQVETFGLNGTVARSDWVGVGSSAPADPPPVKATGLTAGTATPTTQALTWDPYPEG